MNNFPGFLIYFDQNKRSPKYPLPISYKITIKSRESQTKKTQHIYTRIIPSYDLGDMHIYSQKRVI